MFLFAGQKYPMTKMLKETLFLKKYTLRYFPTNFAYISWLTILLLLPVRGVLGRGRRPGPLRISWDRRQRPHLRRPGKDQPQQRVQPGQERKCYLTLFPRYKAHNDKLYAWTAFPSALFPLISFFPSILCNGDARILYDDDAPRIQAPPLVALIYDFFYPAFRFRFE